MSLSLATHIVHTLFEQGYTAYFAGGWVRDYLLGVTSEEIDIATSAAPQKIQELFPKTIPVGIAFGVMIVVLEGIQFEVTTFRKDHPYHDGRHPEGVDFSTPQRDASRRDFTINGMFYDPLTEEIHDFVNGQKDLKKKIIRAIGDPHARFSEDRLRMIRAVRFAARLGFTIEENTQQEILSHAKTLFPAVSMERVWQELKKMSQNAHFDQALLTLHKLGLLQTIFPDLQKMPLETLQKQVAPFPYFPLDCPTMVYLLELFPKHTLKEKIALCHYLRTTGNDAKLVEFFDTAHQLFSKKESEMVEWAHFYAHPDAPLYLEVQAAKVLPPHREEWVKRHQKQQQKLSAHIQRLKKRSPLIDAARLQKEGIQPGKKMGLLLREAERLAINENLSNPDHILQKLKKTSFWKLGNEE